MRPVARGTASQDNHGSTRRPLRLEALEPRVLLSGLVAHWTFDEGSGATAFDSSGNGHDGTLVNGPTWVTGIQGGALCFDGTNDYVQVGAADVATPWTVAVWVLRENSPAIAARLMDSTAASLRLEQHPDINVLGFTRYTVADYSFSHQAPVGTWAHLAFVSSGSTTTLYINGAPMQTLGQTIPAPMTTIGATTNPLKGTLDDLRVYDYALSPAEILALTELPPVGVPDSYSDIPIQGEFDPGAPGVLLNDYDPDADPLVAVPVTAPDHGDLTLREDGSFLYEPADGFFGTDSFTYQPQEAGGGALGNVTTVTLEVEPLQVALVTPAPGGIVATSPTSIEAQFTYAPAPATVGTTTFLLLGSGGDGTFGDGNEVAIVPAGVSMTSSTVATLDLTGVPLAPDLYRVTLIGTGAAPIADPNGFALDGEFSGAFASGDGVPGGDFAATFRYLPAIFTDVTATQFPAVRSATGNTFLDIDNDGDLDIVDTAASFGGNFVYLNDGGGVYSQAPGNAGLPTNGEGHSVIPGDFDDDGYTDFAIGWYWAGGSKLYHNNGNGTFTDVSTSSGVGNPGNIHGGAFTDVEGDGDLDLSFAVNGANRLYINDGTGHFSEQAAARGLALSGYGICTIFADIDGDGDADVLATTSESTASKLMRNDGAGYFTDITAAAGLPSGNFQGTFADFDNDGDLDLGYSGGGLYRNDGTGTFTLLPGSGVPAANSAGTWGDANQDGYLDLFGGGKLFINNGNLTFADFTAGSGISGVGDPYSLIFGDIDGDGDLDVRSSSKLLENLADDGNWLIVRAATDAGSPAIHAKVWVYEAGHLGDAACLLGYREILGGTTPHSGGPLYAHFGLPNDATVDVRVRFLAGGETRDLLSVSRGQEITLGEDPPTLTLDAPATNLAVLQGERVTLQWTDADDDDNALIGLAFDPDDVAEPWTDADHTWIAQGLAEDPDGAGDQLLWNTAGVAPGTYTLWGVIDDGTNPPVYTRALGRVTVLGTLLDTRTSGNAQVRIYDMAGPGDVNPANVLVKFGAGGQVASIALSGTQPMAGLGIVVSGASTVGKVSDGRKGLLGDIAFFASNAPVSSLALRGSLAGYDLNGVQVGGTLLPQDIDGDGNSDDATGLLVQGALGKTSITGNLASDAWVNGSLASLSVSGGVTGDLTVLGSLPKLSVTGACNGALSVAWLGSAKIGGAWAGSATATGADLKSGASFGKLSAARLGNLVLNGPGGVSSLSAAAWADGALHAAWLGSLSLKGATGVPGDCGADLTLLGAPGVTTLGKASIAGTLLDAAWDIAGVVSSLTVGRWGAGSRLAVGVGPGLDGVYFTGDDVALTGSVSKLTITAYDTAHGHDFGVLAPLFGSIGLAGLRTVPLPFANGQFRIVRVV